MPAATVASRQYSGSPSKPSTATSPYTPSHLVAWFHRGRSLPDAIFEDDVTSCAGVSASIRVPFPSLRCPFVADRAVRLRPEALGLPLPSPVCARLAHTPPQHRTLNAGD